MPVVETCENQFLIMSDVQSDQTLSTRSSSEIGEAMIAVKLYENLITELRCPGCACPMEAPIKLCETGHSVCNLCTKMLAKCPLCFNSFTEIRSLTLEAVSAKAQFRCSNSSSGCPVRLQLSLLGKHEEQCAYQLGDCFMGKVWGNCKWHSRKMDWMSHCELDHREKVFFGAEVTRTWELKRTPPKAICGYFVFRVFGESFHFYQIFDNHRNKLCWTMVVDSRDPNVAKRYSFEVELFSPSDETKISVQRNPCHAERDADKLRDGQCANFDLGEIMRFMDENRILHYRIKIVENTLRQLAHVKTSPNIGIGERRFLEIDFRQTNIEGSNMKQIPSKQIITRRSSNSSKTSSLTGGSPKNDSSISDVTSPNPNESPKSTAKNSPIASLKRLLSKKSMKFGSNTSISSATELDSPNDVKAKIEAPVGDSIDQTIIENNDLKKMCVRSNSIDFKNIEDFLEESSAALNRVNSIPKPPRISVDYEKDKNNEILGIVQQNGKISKDNEDVSISGK